MKRHAFSFALLGLVALASACVDEGPYTMRIDNQLSESVSVQVGETDFGAIDADTVSEYLEVESGMPLMLGGETLVEELTLGSPPDGSSFTYTFQEGPEPDVLLHGLTAD